MSKVYFTVKTAKERGFDYSSNFAGVESCHYDAESLLSTAAKTIEKYSDKTVVLRMGIPDSDGVGQILRTLVQGHNLKLRLSGDEWRREARRALGTLDKI